MKRESLSDRLLSLAVKSETCRDSHDILWYASGMMEAISDQGNGVRYSASEVSALLSTICTYNRES